MDPVGEVVLDVELVEPVLEVLVVEEVLLAKEVGMWVGELKEPEHSVGHDVEAVLPGEVLVDHVVEAESSLLDAVGGEFLDGE